MLINASGCFFQVTADETHLAEIHSLLNIINVHDFDLVFTICRDIWVDLDNDGKDYGLFSSFLQ